MKHGQSQMTNWLRNDKYLCRICQAVCRFKSSASNGYDVGLKNSLQQIYLAVEPKMLWGRVEIKSTIDLGLQTQIAEIVQEFEARHKSSRHSTSSSG